MAGRPRGFDPDQALEEAMQLFWFQGYEATGIKALLDRMGIGYQSLYNTFGNKRELYLETLRRYDTWTRGRLQGVLEARGSPLDNVRKVMRSWIGRASDPDYIGCFVGVSIAELAIHDEEVASITRGHLESVEELFYAALVRARDAGELTTDIPPRKLARFLVHSVRGMEVVAKAGVGPEAIEDIVDTVLSVVR